MKINDILFLFLSIFFVSVIWIGFSIYNSAVTSTISDSLAIDIAPIQPQFDQAAITSIRGRTAVNPALQVQKSASASTTLEETTPTPTPKVTTAPVLDESATASSSGIEEIPEDTTDELLNP